MITGAHVLLYSKDAEKDRAFLRDIIGLRAIDIGHGWMIFAMPPSEATRCVHENSHGALGHSHDDSAAQRRRGGPVRTEASDGDLKTQERRRE